MSGIAKQTLLGAGWAQGKGRSRHGEGRAHVCEAMTSNGKQRNIGPTYRVRMPCLPRGSGLVSMRRETPREVWHQRTYISAALAREDIFVVGRLALKVLVNDGGHGGRLSRSARRAGLRGSRCRANVYVVRGVWQASSDYIQPSQARRQSRGGTETGAGAMASS